MRAAVRAAAVAYAAAAVARAAAAAVVAAAAAAAAAARTARTARTAAAASAQFLYDSSRLSVTNHKGGEAAAPVPFPSAFPAATADQPGPVAGSRIVVEDGAAAAAAFFLRLAGGAPSDAGVEPAASPPAQRSERGWKHARAMGPLG